MKGVDDKLGTENISRGSVRNPSYAESGVDEGREQEALKGMRRFFSKTLGLRTGAGRAIADTDHFGSLVDLGAGQALAISTDGVGTKLMIAQQLKSYREIAFDLVANNVNDILCMGAEPVGIVDYIGIDIADERFLEEFADSFSTAALEAGVSVLGGEIAQIGEMLNPQHGSPRFELVATAIGLCRLEESAPGAFPVALNRSAVKAGDVLIGLPSSGIHSNGLSLARKALFDCASLKMDSTLESLAGERLSSALLTPTRIYVQAILPLLRSNLVNGLANISGGGLLTVTRLNPSVSFEIHSLPEAHPIFRVIAQAGNLTEAEMYSTFNMGTGMVMAAAEGNVATIISLLEQHGETGMVMGRVVSDNSSPGTVRIPSLNLTGRGDAFRMS